MTTARKLHAVEGTPPPKRDKTVAEAASSGSRRELLVSMRARVAAKVDDQKTPAAALAALTNRLLEIVKEIEAIDASSDDDAIAAAGATPDDSWDESAI